MNDGRTVWWSKDAAWWRREWIVELGEEFGAAGPAVIDWLWCEAKAQNAGGWVKTGPRSIARGCFVDADMVSHVLSRSVTLGLLDEYTDERGRFSCRLSGYQADQERAQAAGRKARQRVKESVDKGDSAPESRFVTPSHAESRSVPECPPTGQDRTEQEKDNTNVELRSTVAECFAYWQERCHHPGVMLSDDRRAKIEARIRERQRHHKGDLSAATVDVRLAIDGAALAPFVDERGKRHDGIALICRNNDKLEDFMGRAASGEVVSLRKDSSHLPEWQRPTPEWQAQVAAHLESQERGA